MSEEIVHFESVGAVALLTLNRPKAMNALTLEMLAALRLHLLRIQSDESLRVVIITGTNPAFCAGADLKQVLAGQTAGEADFIDRVGETFGLLRSFPKPVIAALNGITLAGGLELAMCADLIIAAESAAIGDAHANFGVYPGAGGAAVLPRRIPLGMAMYLLFTGKSLSAAEMKTCGLVCEVHPDDQLKTAALDLAALIATKSPIALKRMKEVARHSADKSESDALLHEQVLFRQHLRSADLQEGLQAFGERRPPHFKGH